MSYQAAVDVLDRTNVIAIVTTKADGSPIATPIWSMVVDGVPYVRSAYGPGSWWYRHCLSGRPVAIMLGDGAVAESDRSAALDLPREPVSVTWVPVDDAVQAAIDAEIQRKYAHAMPSSIAAMLSDEARACTLRVDRPADA